MHLCADHGESFALGRIDLARHDAAARLVFGQLELTQPTPGARPQEADVVRNLEEGHSRRVEGIAHLHHCIMPR